MLRLVRLARPMRWQLLLAVASGAAATGSAVALLAVSGFLLARASQQPNIVAISIAVVAVRALGISRGAFRYIERLASHDVAFRVLADVRVAIYRKLERLAPAGLAAFRSGDLLATLVSDVDATQDLFIRGIAPPAAAALVGAGAMSVCLVLLAPAGLVLATGLLLAGLAVPWLTAAVSRRAAAVTAPARGDLAAQFADMLAGAADLHALGAQDEALAQITAADRALTAMTRRSATAAALGTGLTTAAAGLTLWAVLTLGVTAVSHGTLTRVPLAVLTLTALAAFEAVTALPAAAIQLAHSRTSATRISTLQDTQDPVSDPPVPTLLPHPPVHIRLSAVQVTYPPATSGRADGRSGQPVQAGPEGLSDPDAPRGQAVEAVPVSSSWPDAPRAQTVQNSHHRLDQSRSGGPSGQAVQVRPQRPSRPDPPRALNGLDLDLPPGRRVALVGPVGAGKSTVASVLLRFCEFTGGTVTLNGIDLRDFAADQTRTLIGGCPQDPYLFDTTIAENVRLARPAATEADLTSAAGRARLLPWIESLPQRWDTRVGAHGLAVSGGERQRIALARAFLADPAVLIWDEPTAHLDRRDRLALTTDLLAASSGRTTLLITHDPLGLKQADEIVVLDRGRVAERGSHEQLMAAGGWYAGMTAGRMT